MCVVCVPVGLRGEEEKDEDEEDEDEEEKKKKENKHNRQHLRSPALNGQRLA